MNLNYFKMLSLFLLFFSIYTINATASVTEDSQLFQLGINVQKNNKTYPIQEGTVFEFSDGEETTITCILKCNSLTCNNIHYYYHLDFYVHQDPVERHIRDISNETTKFYNETTLSISKTFTLQKNDTEIVCDASCFRCTWGPYLGKNSIFRVRLQHVPPPQAAPGREDRLLTPSLPQISPGYFKDNGETFALFTCTAPMEGIASMSWQQMKGSDLVILKTVTPFNHTADVMQDTLNKTLKESDRDTKLFCATRYILEGTSLSDERLSKIINLTFNRTIESSFQETRMLSFTEWLAIFGAIIVAALIVAIILVAVILKYRRKVKEYEREEQIKNRPAIMPPPPTECVYDRVYDHGAGLKRPSKDRRTEKLH